MEGYTLDSRSQKWIKQGRGSGIGDSYKPWLTVRDLPSAGRSHRIWGVKTQRLHHFLSDLELAVFFLFEWNPSVTDIREQFPLSIEDTFDIAIQAGIRHPQLNGHVQIMSSDFLVDSTSFDFPKMAIQVKTRSDLYNPRTVEKLEIERRYWEMKKIPWRLFTEEQIPKVVIKNITWLYPLLKAPNELDDALGNSSFYQTFFHQSPILRISEAAMAIDQAYSFASGESLKMIRILMAFRVFVFDIRKPWSDITVGELQLSPNISAMRERYAANQ